MIPRLLLWGTRPADPLRLSECERDADFGRRLGVEGFGANARGSFVGDCTVNEEMERGQEMERRIGPERTGDTEGVALGGLTGGFQCTLPVPKKKDKSAKIYGHANKPAHSGTVCVTGGCFS